MTATCYKLTFPFGTDLSLPVDGLEIFGGASSSYLLPQGLTASLIFLVSFPVFPTKNDEETKKFKLFLLGKLTK